MKNSIKSTGDNGEQLAADYLASIGHTVIERNWVCGHLELDIVTIAEDGLHFVEVKSRNAPLSADPLANMTRSKKHTFLKAAEAYSHRNGKFLPDEMFFDVITVVFTGTGHMIEYYKQAIIPIYT